MKSAKKQLCNSKLCFLFAAIIVCFLYLFYYQLSVDDSVSFQLSSSFDRLDVPSHLYGVCPLPLTISRTPIIENKKVCAFKAPLTIVSETGQIVLNPALAQSEKQNKSCYARPLHDVTSWPWTWLKAIAVFFTRNKKLFWYALADAGKIGDDFIEVECIGYNNFHGRVRRREEIPKRVNNTPDVFIIHVRSLKYNLFTPQTTQFLEEAMGAVHFHNYQSLGDDYVDFGAALSGGLAVRLSRERMGSREVPTNLPRSYYDDPCFLARSTSFLPRLFLQEGYATLIADENKIHESRFEPGCEWEPANLYSPVLHLFPPAAGCKFANRVFDYFERFLDVYDDSAKFATIRILHDDVVVDEELLLMIRRMKSKLENAYVFFIADVSGAQNPSPYATPAQNLWISVPEQLRDSETMANLLSNQHALATPFDVSATLRSIAGLDSSSTGSSLLDKFPSSVRDCVRLPIPLQHCPCPVAMMNYTDTATLFEAAETALVPLSKLLKPYDCKPWDVERIYAVRRLEKLPLVEIFVAVRPLERFGGTHRYDRLEFPVFKLMADETRMANGELAFTGLPELTVAIKPVDASLSPCTKGHWLRILTREAPKSTEAILKTTHMGMYGYGRDAQNSFCYCELWAL